NRLRAGSRQDRRRGSRRCARARFGARARHALVPRPAAAHGTCGGGRMTAATATAATTATVLVVEDDLHLRDGGVTTLAMAGYNVLEAGDGGAALEVLDARSIDLVVTDVEMKPVNGRELLERARATHPGVPVLMMTAYGTIEQAVAAMRDGAVDYLVKPFEAD